MHGQVKHNSKTRSTRCKLGLVLIALTLLFAIVPHRPAMAQNKNAIKLKTAFIYKFTRFIRWPQAALRGQKNFVITVYGKGTLGRFLSLLQKRKAQGLPIKVHRITDWRKYQPSHIVVVPRGNARKMHINAIKKLRKRPVLVVVEGKGLARAGAHINFFFDANTGTIGFELNIDAMKRSRLGVPAALLRVADVVREKPQPNAQPK